MVLKTKATKTCPKIIQLGFHKCGTSSLSHFLNASNIKTCHWEKGEIAKSFFSRMKKSEPGFLDWNAYIGFTDTQYFSREIMLEPYKEYEYIYKFYPDAYYILNTRYIEEWIESRMAHRKGSVIEVYKSNLNIKTKKDIIDYWRQDWKSYHKSVKTFFRNKKNFMIYHINENHPRDLCNFLKGDFDGLSWQNYEVKNATAK